MSIGRNVFDVAASLDADIRRLTGMGANECQECGRVFDLSNPVAAGEWIYGHDCEVSR